MVTEAGSLVQSVRLIYLVFAFPCVTDSFHCSPRHGYCILISRSVCLLRVAVLKLLWDSKKCAKNSWSFI